MSIRYYYTQCNAQAINERLSQIDENEYTRMVEAMKKYEPDHIWKPSDGSKSRIPENILREVLRVSMEHNLKVKYQNF